MRVADIAHGRSGDKGDTCNVGIVAYDDEGYAVLRARLTAERVKEHYGDLVKGTVTRYEMPGIRALNFVLTRALDGGGTMSLRSDHLGKVMYAWLLRLDLDAPPAADRWPPGRVALERHDPSRRPAETRSVWGRGEAARRRDAL
jgi:hypothetical protein